jgi:hypothetical protein
MPPTARRFCTGEGSKSTPRAKREGEERDAMKRLFLMLLLIPMMAGCAGHYVGKAYGVSGKQYTAPDLCQAVAQCAAAGEAKCFYSHGTEFSCTESEPKAK